METNPIKWIWIQICPFIASFIEMLLLGGLISGNIVFCAVISKGLIDSIINGNLELGIKMLIIFSILMLLQIVMRSYLSVINKKLEENLANHLREKLLKKILRADWSKISSFHSDDILTRLTRDLGVFVNTVVTIIPETFALGIQFIIAFFVLASYNKTVALIALITAPVGVFLSKLLGRKIKKYSIMIKESEGDYRAYIHELLQNLLVVKSLRIEKRSISKLNSLHDINLSWVMINNKTNLVINIILYLTYWTSYITAFVICIYNVYLKKLTFGAFTVFIQLFGQVHGSLEGLFYQFPQLLHALACVDRLIEIEAVEQELDSSCAPSAKGVITVFDDVSFRYEKDKPLLEKINFTINHGDFIAVVGSSGAGKTTLTRLMLSLIKPQSGRIYYVSRKGEAIECNPTSRNFISYVPQGNTIFSGTIRENLLHGNPNAVNEELIEALRDAEALSFVMQLPLGLDSVIGERGIGISEGQAQRLSIARALLVRAPILIFDEATSSLDVETEEKIICNLRRLTDKRTCIIITHRPTAMKLCDRLVSIEAGMVYENMNFNKDQGSEAG